MSEPLRVRLWKSPEGALKLFITGRNRAGLLNKNISKSVEKLKDVNSLIYFIMEDSNEQPDHSRIFSRKWNDEYVLNVQVKMSTRFFGGAIVTGAWYSYLEESTYLDDEIKPLKLIE
jgi:hypothetical protein